MRTMTTILGAVLLLLSCVTTTRAQLIISEPDLSGGSQLIFYYDAREGSTTFLNVRNSGSQPVRVHFLLCSPTFESQIIQAFTLAAGAVRVIDIGAEKAAGTIPAQQGIALLSVVNEDLLPIEQPVLTGNFTVANLATGSAWGSPAIGRSARSVIDGKAPPTGTVINAMTVLYQIIEPDILRLATYYNPETLAPVEARGSQIIFVNFQDSFANALLLASASTTWDVTATRGAEGTPLSGQIEVSGVTDRDLVSVFGTEANGASGGGGFTRVGGSVNATRFIFFVQALGTFGMGHLLPNL